MNHLSLSDKDIEEIFGVNPLDCKKCPIVRILLGDSTDGLMFVDVPAKTIVKEVIKRLEYSQGE
jgi:hypothetical protein